jgi:MFS family permease
MSTDPLPKPRGDPAAMAPHRLWPLYAAGFVTAFGAHSVAASLAGYTQHQHASLLALGVLLAVYDGAEVVLKPLFGWLADRIGARPVLLGGLLAFATASTMFVTASDPTAVGMSRLGQGAAAAAFSPAASALLARISPSTRHGRAFGGYGACKSLGYTFGPVLGGLLITISGYPLLFATLAGLAIAVAGRALLVVPVIPPLPRARQTVFDLARRVTQGPFLRPTVALAGSTAALAVGVGFLPVAGAAHGLGPLLTGVSVSLLAGCATLVQPWAGRARDAGHLSDRVGMATGLGLAAAGLILAAVLPGTTGVFTAAVTTGIGTGMATPLGFAHLARTTPPARLGQTMGSAEVGRELGDAGGPLLVGALATSTTLSIGLASLAALLAASAAAILKNRPTLHSKTGH